MAQPRALAVLLAAALAAWRAAPAAGAPPADTLAAMYNGTVPEEMFRQVYWGGPERGCAPVEGVGKLTLECALPAGRVTLAADRGATYLSLQCEEEKGRAGRFGCEELQQHAGEALRNYTNDALQQHAGEPRVLRSLTVAGCRLEEPLRCLVLLAGAADVARLELRDVPTPLQPDHLAGLGAVEHLRVRAAGGEVRSVPYEAVEALPELRRLDLSGAALRLAEGWRPRANLTMLELAEDALATLPARAFEGLPQLRNLSLRQNRIETIHEDAFQGLASLERLSLNGNGLRALPSGALLAAPRLRQLQLHGSRLPALPPLAPLLHLEEVWVNNQNRTELQLDNDTFANLPALRQLKVESCGVRALPAGLLRGSRALLLLSLQGNALAELPAELLAEHADLRTLNLARNRLRSLPRALLARTSALEELNLSRNDIATLPDGVFLGLAALRNLDLSRNRLKELQPRVFEGVRALSWLVLSHNELTMSTRGAGEARLSPLVALHSLARLELAHNAVARLMDDWRDMPQLQDLDLSYNNITELDEVDLQLLGAARVDVRHNRIARVRQLGDAAAGAAGGLLSRARFLLDHNPFACDCYMFHFVRGLARRGFADQFEMSHASCASPPALAGAPLAAVPPGALRCALPAPACPARCACALHPASDALELDCETAPGSAPAPDQYGLESVRLRLRTPPADLSALPPAVLAVDLSALGLTEAPALTAPRPGLVVDLSNNSLTSAPVALLEGNCTVVLGGNPLACDCAHRASVAALLAAGARVADAGALQCREGGALAALRPARLCDARDAQALGGLLLAAAGVVLFSLLVLTFRYATEIRLLLRRYQCLDCLFPEKDAGAPDKKYDAFVSFSHHDDEWVRSALLPRLEGGWRALRLCVHFRDWEVGGLIPEQIDRSVRESRRTVVVLSREFVVSVWGRVEFRAAHALERVIVLLLPGALAAARGDPELRAYLATNTYVESDDPLVWDRIKDAVRRPRLRAAAPAPPATPAPPGLKGGALDVQLRDGMLVNAAAKVDGAVPS